MRNKLVKYEKDFVQKCKQSKIRVKPDEDGCPVARPRTKGYRKIFTLVPWSPTLYGIVIICETAHKKKSMVKKIKSRVPDCELRVDGDTEAIVLMSWKGVEDVKYALKFASNRVFTPEQMEEIKNRLEKARNARGL